MKRFWGPGGPVEEGCFRMENADSSDSLKNLKQSHIVDSKGAIVQRIKRVTVGHRD